MSDKSKTDQLHDDLAKLEFQMGITIIKYLAIFYFFLFLLTNF